MRNALRDFKEFVLKGDVVALAVAVIIATAFGALIAAFVANIITPLIAAIGGKTNFGNLAFTINGSRFAYGDFLNAALTFVIVAAVMFFLVIKPVNVLLDAMQTEPEVDSPTRPCPECLSQIPRAASRCAFCTTEVAAESA